ncbi:MAG: hypothetical protein IH987_00475 [Planctomycetes bacterium]|nr:hypothetical protein [Planctomycetota bacterium]
MNARRDMFCLNCGYNLRGHSGDPVRCPECGHTNQLADLEVPAELMVRALRRMETGAALCGATASALFYWLLPVLAVMLFQLHPPLPLYIWVFVFAAIVASVVFWIVGVFFFRASCGGKQGWFGALWRFNALVCLVVGMSVSVIFLLWWGWLVVKASGPGIPVAEIILVIVCAPGLLLGTVWLYRRAKHMIRRLQRETAAYYARSHWLTDRD